MLLSNLQIKFIQSQFQELLTSFLKLLIYVKRYQVRSLSNLKTKNFITASNDQTKLLIFSWQQSQTTPLTKYDWVLKLFKYSGSSWSQILAGDASLSGVSYTEPNIANSLVNLDFVKIGLSSLNQNSTLVNDYKLLLIDFINLSVSVVTTPNEIKSLGTGITTTLNLINQKYLYYFSPSKSPNNIELVYKVDIQNKTLTQISRKILIYSQVQLSLNYFVVADVNLGFADIWLNSLTYQNQNVIVQIIKKRALLKEDQIVENAAVILLNGIQQFSTGLVTSKDKIQLAPPGCLLATNPTQCLSCSLGFAYDITANLCVRCNSPCKFCSTSTPNICTACFDGYYLNGNSCLRCDDTCLTCSAPGFDKCVSCDLGSFLNQGICLSCIQSCEKCIAADTCDTCKIGFSYSTILKICVKCLSGCTNCNPDKIYQCKGCIDGFEAIYDSNTTALKKCAKCSNNCKKCYFGTCTLCQPNFNLVNNTCIQKCKLPCKQCNPSNPLSCTSCINGYNLTKNTCTPDLSCNTGFKCESCPLGFNLITGGCYQCNSGSNCQTCEISSSSKCTSCSRGYYLTTTATCSACIIGCSQCLNGVYCYTCKSGFTLIGTNSNSKCIKCDSKCNTCLGSSAYCLTCAPGFTLQGWNCIKTNNVQFIFIVNADISALTSSNVTNFKADLCTAINKQDDDVTTKSIYPSSIVFEGAVNANSVTEQSALVNSLATAFGFGSTIGGFSIISSSFTAVMGDVPAVSNEEAIRYRNIAIIVGVVIPIGLILLFIVFFLLYKNKVICNESSNRVIEMVSMQKIQVDKPTQSKTWRDNN